MALNDAAGGARNLLLNCASAKQGDRLLIAREGAEYGYFDDKVADHVAAAAQDAGLDVRITDVGFNPEEPHLTPDLLRQFEAADIILFLARLGDQMRFSDMPPGKRIIVSFAVNETLLASGFGNGHYAAFTGLKSAINHMFDAAMDVHVTCAAGTDVRGRPVMDLSAKGDTSILRFPMSIFAPVPAHEFSGRVALCGFLTGTGSRYYDGYHLDFDDQVFALLRNGRLAGFDGPAQDVAKANAHYDRVAGQFGIDRDFVHSWHAGIHPGCGYPWPINENAELWGGTAFGNPRILHFHTCGAYAPGEISWNMVDPSITVDGVTVWEGGHLHIDRVPGARRILEAYPDVATIFAHPDRQIGLDPAGQYEAIDLAQRPQLV
ncbi:hypothetical protein E2K80_12060 [Rhodophyticola sp. CCM32]|uniref:hypothetical protein n=1 Tax=Rhodophyticola sp. CCM32 TaxID=2916397 RepID=UPI00107F0545|nr:hypothetical protein [Rhodophyticola sp. CCM32]QBY01370.1 hypothetical protein E2K80_12060 [Rhodophyticola sp. CCM32]